MVTQFKLLFSPLTIKEVTFRNRIVMPAMNNNFANSDGSVSDQYRDYYVERGRGGAALIINSPAYVDPAARKRAGGILLHDDRLIPQMKVFTDAIHATGARVFQQLNHNGRLLSSSRDLKTAVTVEPIGPSAVPRLLTGVVPRAMTEEEIGHMVEMFAQTARRAKEAGFDGVELHGAHGYLINQFFSLYTNRRTDSYGGSLENRMRFPIEIYRRVRELTGSNFLVSYRITAREYVPIETPFEDTIVFAQRLAREGVDMLHVTAGSGETPATILKIGPPGSTPRGCYADFAAAIKTEVAIPVIAVARINTPEIAEEILEKKKADLVATGRALICDPHWPEKAQRGEAGRIRRCTACNQGCHDRLSNEQKISCLYNPEVGREGETASPPERKKKVWVIGGGPGGMEAAVVASARGHEVELFEKEGELGGQLLLALIPPGKEEYAAVGEFLKKELRRLNVQIHLNDRCTIDKVVKGQPDVVILATGSLPLVPDILGVNEEHVVTAWDVIKGKEVGQRVLIAGGGLVGAECAVYLAQEKGKEVVLIELLDRVAQDVGAWNRARIVEELKETTVEVKCKTALVSICKDGAVVKDETGEYTLPADTVVLALGVRALNSLQRDLSGKISEVYAVGDCATPGKMIDAIHAAYDVAMEV